MKITINIDCTPEEARKFMGLPDVAEFHKFMMDEFKKKAEKGFDPAELDNMMQEWTKNATAGMSEWQKLFMNSMSKK